jgi:ribosomal-protein-alanine N-acetyltransferase
VNRQPLSLTIDPLILADIPAAIALEQAAYLKAHLHRNYDYELQHNPLAHYLALRLGAPQLNPPIQLVGLGGLWLILDEIHIITIAVHPDWKGMGLGEWLLINLLEKGQALGATVATLEVRPSNKVAISLYQKYAFQEVGVRPDYYPDNHEAALILMTPPLNSDDYRARFTQNKVKLLDRLARRNMEISNNEG